MMVEVLDSCVQAQKFLSAFSPLESLLMSLLVPCRTLGLSNDVVTPGCRNYLLVINVDQTRDFPDRSSVAAELIGMDDLWAIVFSQQPGQEGLYRFGVPIPLEKNVEYEALLVDRPPKPVSNAIHARTGLVEMPPGTQTGFPVAQIFREERGKFHVPLTEGLVTDLNAALEEQFLHISVAERKTVVQPLWACWMMVMAQRWRYGLASVTADQLTPTRLRQHNPCICSLSCAEAATNCSAFRSAGFTHPLLPGQADDGSTPPVWCG